jgi:hypothetical protein
MVGEISGQFSPTKFHLSILESLASCGRGGIWRRKLECLELDGVREGIQVCTISLHVAVYPRRMPRALIEKKKPSNSMITRGLKLNTSQHVARRLEIRGTVTPRHHTP